jgi:hypothetical protein
MKLPAGPGAPAPDAAAALREATAACRAVTAISADIAASGKIEGQRLRGHLLAGLAAPASARLEAVAPAGQPLFIFVSQDDDATLLLPRDNRVIEHGPPAQLLEAVTGVPVDAEALRHLLTGCVGQTAAAGRSLGDDWRALTVGATDVYLHRDGKDPRWQLTAAVHRDVQEGSPPAGSTRSSPSLEWRAEYRNFEGGLPRSIRLVSADGTRFDLSLALAQVELNEVFGQDVFRVQVPPSAERITVDDFRHARPGVRED